MKTKDPALAMLLELKKKLEELKPGELKKLFDEHRVSEKEAEKYAILEQIINTEATKTS